MSPRRPKLTANERTVCVRDETGRAVPPVALSRMLRTEPYVRSMPNVTRTASVLCAATNLNRPEAAKVNKKLMNFPGTPWRPSSSSLASFSEAPPDRASGVGLGDRFCGVLTMTAFSCAACGSHAFRLSADLRQAHCEQCKLPLGSWQALRAKIKQNLRPLQPALRMHLGSAEVVLP
jgi:hypothetical protein